MESKKNETLEATIPVEALCEVLDHYWRQEVRSYRADPAECHIFRQLAAIANWLAGGTGWTATDYATAAGVMPEMTWRVAGIAAGSPPPESKLPRAEGEPKATWVQEGPNRYMVRGRKPSVRVVVGWDRPMSTYFAQVWDVPEGASHHEEGNLLLWLGTSFHEVEEVDDLAAALEAFVTLPKSLRSGLVGDMVFGD